MYNFHFFLKTITFLIILKTVHVYRHIYIYIYIIYSPIFLKKQISFANTLILKWHIKDPRADNVIPRESRQTLARDPSSSSSLFFFFTKGSVRTNNIISLVKMLRTLYARDFRVRSMDISWTWHECRYGGNIISLFADSINFGTAYVRFIERAPCVLPAH